MRVAVSSKGEKIGGDVDGVFGRCSYFIIADVEDGRIVGTESLGNLSKNKTGGAGISAAQMMAEHGVNVVISGSVGPRALDVLRQFDIEAYRAHGQIEKAIENLIKKKLERVDK
jgi:predicted Fe-Mo cluster-binding NifX family protein